MDEVESRNRTITEFMELVIGVTSAIGTPDDEVFQALEADLHLYDYQVETIKVSQLIQDELVAAWPKDPRPYERVQLLIDKGNQICEASASRAALAMKAIDEIVARRDAYDQLLQRRVASNDETPHAAGRLAFIVDSLKRPDEAALLREVYGDRFILIGLTATEGDRKAHLHDTYKPTFQDDEENLTSSVSALIKRDETEDHKFGQDVAGVLPLADAFVRIDPNDDGKTQIERILSLLFADPKASPPTVEEYGMQVAAQAATLSPELGLRVGAAVLTTDGHVLATGRNHHPTAETSPAFDAGVVDLRQMLKNLLILMAKDKLLSKKAKKKLTADPEAYVRSLLSGSLKKSELRDITEYQRPVHAEMDALLSMLRQQVSPVNSKAYVTAYPCHNCAKHLIAAGLEVVYLEPYVKSRVASMYAEHVDRFRPFSGVAPRRYSAWFIEARRADRKDKVGVAVAWTSDKRRKARPHLTPGVTSASVHTREDLARRVDEAEDGQDGGVTPPEGSKPATNLDGTGATDD